MTTTQTIAEDSSKKPKRGRPRRWDYDLVERDPDLLLARTHRGKTEFTLACWVGVTLKELYESDPVANRWALFYLGPKAQSFRRLTVLSALGRIDDKDTQLKFAREIADAGYTARRAVSLIRAWRTGKTSVHDHPELCVSLERFANELLDRRPGTTIPAIIRALRDFADLLDEPEGDER